MAEPAANPSSKPFLRTLTPTKEQIMLQRWGAWVESEVDAKADPACLPFSALLRMDTHPIVYLAEQAITALVRRPDGYHVTHPLDDKKLIAETEEWLWALGRRGLHSIIARAFVFGAVPYVLDVENGEFVVRVPAEDSDAKPRKRTIPDYWRYTAAHELRPDRVTIDVDARGRLDALHDHATGIVYDRGRGRVAVWDQQFGTWHGQSARRRAWPAYAKSKVFELLQARYLERTVHTPLIIYAPGKDVRKEGEDADMPVGEYIAEQLETLMGGGYMNLPSDLQGTGDKRAFEAVPLELPERSEVWNRALDRFDSQIFSAYLVPPAMAGSAEDASMGGGGARVLEGQFATFIESLTGFVAAELTEIVHAVHRLNYAPGEKLPCDVGANEIPDKVQKRYLDVLGKVGDAAMLGQRVDVNQLLDYLDVPRLPNAPAGGAPPGTPVGAEPGRPRSPTGKREERREDATTPEGQEDTGAPRDQDGEPEPNT